ncbi:MAG: D-2-hydroxyacid dehydrogenase [Acetobacteraceae bacterium]|nr:D-2-hydroxyacid dehydrogenase [Acetobacteraceae bacterium]
MSPLPEDKDLTVLFAHVAYQGAARAQARGLSHRLLSATNREELDRLIPEADVLVVSGMWRNDLPKIAPRLKLVQSYSAGTDQYDRAVFREHGIRLASAAGANAEAVAEHAVSLVLGIKRKLFIARDDQHKAHWSGMKADFAQREDEIAGKTAIVVGMGRIGSRLIELLKAFRMTVLGVRANPAAGAEGADEVHPLSAMPQLLPRADFVVLVCPLTAETTGLMNKAAFAAMKPSAWVVNCARGKVCDEADLIEALRARTIAGAALDVTAVEPLPADSPLWSLPNCFVTPHTAGETCAYEDNVLDLMSENIRRLRSGEPLANQVV